MIPGLASRRRFSDLSEAEILALAISSEEDDARIYGDIADGLKAEYPATVNARWGANRAKTLKEFNAKLAAPLAINLNQKPLRGNSVYPRIENARKRSWMSP